MTVTQPSNIPPPPVQLAVLKEAARLIDSGVDRPSAFHIANALSMSESDVVSAMGQLTGELTYKTRTHHGGPTTFVLEITENGRVVLERFA